MTDQTKDLPNEPPPSYEETLAHTFGGQQPPYPVTQPNKPPDQPYYGYPQQGVAPPVGGASMPSAPTQPGYPPQVSQYPTNPYAPPTSYPGAHPPYPQQPYPQQQQQPGVMPYNTTGGNYTHPSVTVMMHRNQNAPNQFIAPGVTAQNNRRKCFMMGLTVAITIVIIIIVITSLF